ncbi:hypothetical protein K438DRAFT_1761141 [Mycena galopus ATCC 62051]|nr:hypothetical protein K438DRAFT_1761141 [Mycena galopus ATCC 62051]
MAAFKFVGLCGTLPACLAAGNESASTRRSFLCHPPKPFRADESLQGRQEYRGSRSNTSEVGESPPADDDRRQQEQDAPEAFALAKGRSSIQLIRETEVDVRDSCHGMEGWSQSVDSRPIVSTEWFEIIPTDWAGWIAMIQSGMLSEGEGKRSRDPSPQNLGVGRWLAAVWRVAGIPDNLTTSNDPQLGSK